MRLHSTFPPSTEAGRQQERKGEVLDKHYLKTIATAIVWDEDADVKEVENVRHVSEEDGEGGDDVWEAMEDAEDGQDQEEDSRQRGKRSRVTS